MPISSSVIYKRTNEPTNPPNDFLPTSTDFLPNVIVNVVFVFVVIVLQVSSVCFSEGYLALGLRALRRRWALAFLLGARATTQVRS